MEKLVAFNSYGGFTKDGSEYRILNTNTPLPWCNVISNENFGSIISTYGTIYTYFKNSREFKISNWCNDWTKVIPGEKFTGIFDKNYNLTYGFGYVKVTDENDKLIKNMNIFIPENDNIKIQNIEIINSNTEDKDFIIEYILSPVLGVTREIDSDNVMSKIEEDMLILKNPYNKHFSNYIAYIKVFNYSENESFKYEYNDEEYKVTVTAKLKVNEKINFSICLGAHDENEDFSIFKKFDTLENLENEFKSTKKYWSKKVKRNFKTGDEYVDIMANGWLIYQTIACRIFAKSAFYQSGGAIGYRDQLQDTMSLISSWPEKTRSQIILHASKQFEKGDVLHWWHPYNMAGIRTYFSDDYLWLAYVLSEYINKTKDYSVLNVEVPYLEHKEMGNHRELYDVFNNTNKLDSVYNHAKKAINYGLSRKNKKNGLLDIGDGDWNDGFSNIRGQSVWLTLFMIDILDKFKVIAQYIKDEEMENICIKERHLLKHSIVTSAYNGEYFVRAFFENGEVLGNSTNDECKIDLISQSWAAISLKNYPDMKEEIKSSLNLADKYLVDRENMIVKLLYPPFDKPKNNPGYIKAYVPGIRENGGQYTHAATWLAKAYFEIGIDKKAMEVLKYINPIHHSDTKEKADIYMVEPFVVAADIYSNKEHLGRGGWTWYTGAAAWTYKVIEDKFSNK